MWLAFVLFFLYGVAGGWLLRLQFYPGGYKGKVKWFIADLALLAAFVAVTCFGFSCLQYPAQFSKPERLFMAIFLVIVYVNGGIFAPAFLAYTLANYRTVRRMSDDTVAVEHWRNLVLPLLMLYGFGIPLAVSITLKQDGIRMMLSYIGTSSLQLSLGVGFFPILCGSIVGASLSGMFGPPMFTQESLARYREKRARKALAAQTGESPS